ncbi:hypothetical protein T4D_9801 [Trichinella pseudospiralis]|uniref:Uncharacterized protein n=1 Tax=Trichinella pseudospiralis TaxID=6337 RepID=A0A0V1FPT2_TRIPS|nr:hypothetical protein T4D_9801 [Trichinella pseudospiralis]
MDYDLNVRFTRSERVIQEFSMLPDADISDLNLKWTVMMIRDFPWARTSLLPYSDAAPRHSEDRDHNTAYASTSLAKFTARTDHISLTLLRNFWEPEGPIARCWENLAEFDFEVVREEAAEPRMHCPDAIAGSVGPVMTPQTSTLRLWRLTQLAPLNGCSRWRERKPVGNNDTKRLGGTGKPTNLFTNPVIRCGCNYRQRPNLGRTGTVCTKSRRSLIGTRTGWRRWEWKITVGDALRTA